MRKCAVLRGDDSGGLCVGPCARVDHARRGLMTPKLRGLMALADPGYPWNSRVSAP